MEKSDVRLIVTNTLILYGIFVVHDLLSEKQKISDYL